MFKESGINSGTGNPLTTAVRVIKFDTIGSGTQSYIGNTSPCYCNNVGVGEFPYIAISLAITFGLYGLIKKPLTIGPMRSVFWEVVFLLPLALIWLVGTHFFGWQGIDF